MTTSSRRYLLLALGLMLMASVSGLVDTPAGVPALRPATEGALARGQQAAIAPAHRDAVALDAVPHYTIRATLLPPGASAPSTSQGATPVPSASPAVATSPSEEATITGRMELRYVNTTGERLDELQLRLYPNLRQYDTGRMEINDLRLDGRPARALPPELRSAPADAAVATPVPEDAELILWRVPLEDALGDGDRVTLTLAFTTTVPVAPPDGTGLFRYLPDTGSWTLAHWFPILAGWDPAGGWESDPPAAWADPTFANTAQYDVTLAAPEELVLVTTGVEIAESTADGWQERRFVTGPARDMVLVAAPDLVASSVEVDGTLVTSWHLPEHAAGGERILTWTAQALTVFNDLFGAYPYATLDVVAVPELVGYEFPQLIMIGMDFYPDPENAGSRPGAIEFLIAHEVAHQWWYGLVGSNTHRHAFLDEALAEYSAVLYFERQHDDEAAARQLDEGLRLRYATMLLTADDAVVDQPTAAFPDLGTYFTTVYRKGGLALHEIRQEIGDDAFFAALRDYADAWRYRDTLPADLLAAFERHGDGDLAAVWERWLTTASGRVDIVMEPLPATPAASPIAPPMPTPAG